jgi:hypothetical protein
MKNGRASSNPVASTIFPMTRMMQAFKGFIRFKLNGVLSTDFKAECSNPEIASSYAVQIPSAVAMSLTFFSW